ncbi:hypothetical protein V6N12_017909 [Hibiscus sabdariffa]|uniref:DUF4283 domain-containing protein n=2 Tax=Hibiscus sabdariffa TaxID=183260 RepID=A0ABR2BKD7_9ROSI
MVVSTGLSTEALEEIHDTTRNTEAAMEDIVSASSNLGMPMVVQDGRTDGTGSSVPLEVVVLVEDYVIDRYGLFHSIKFSERVHEHIDNNMRNTIIVSLLGRLIGYKTLLFLIHAIWKPLGELQLIDLDNFYFLVRFENEVDYSKVLTEVVGRVVRVDYNTQEGERGRISLPWQYGPLLPCIGEKMTEVVSQPDVGRVVVEHIEASSSRAEDLYEPWMLVDTRRRRSTPSNGGSTPVESGWITNDSNGGSMSTALEGVEEASM